jgi:transcriptional regulator with XRE-family HTH domain
MEDIQERIALIISTKGMTNAEFAEAINVQPSNISHIMSGRNKPSLDLVMKILKRFPELRTEWLLNGKGAMNQEQNLFDLMEMDRSRPAGYPVNKKPEVEKLPQQQDMKQPDPVKKTPQPSTERKAGEENSRKDRGDIDLKSGITMEKLADKKVEKIVVFYTDKTFDLFTPTDD